MLSTMLFADEIVPARRRRGVRARSPPRSSPKELAIAEQLVGSLSADWDPDRYKDTYRERVIDLVQRQGRRPRDRRARRPEPTAKVDDLMAALEASLAAATQQAAATKKAGRPKKPRRAAGGQEVLARR